MLQNMATKPVPNKAEKAEWNFRISFIKRLLWRHWSPFLLRQAIR
jgi:hypothetical protein